MRRHGAGKRVGSSLSGQARQASAVALVIVVAVVMVETWRGRRGESPPEDLGSMDCVDIQRW
jgi:hypothetical protein